METKHINLKNALLVLTAVLLLFCCKKKEVYFDGEYNPDVIKNYENETAPISKIDSLGAISLIARQKLNEVYELSALVNTKSDNDTLMENILLAQLETYFMPNDSMAVKNLLSEMNQYHVSYIKIKNFEHLPADSLRPDSIKFMKYNVDYFSKEKKRTNSISKTALFVLKQDAQKVKGEFKFYFKSLNDTIPLGVTR